MSKVIYKAVLDKYTCVACNARDGRTALTNDKPFGVCQNEGTDVGCRCVLVEVKESENEQT